jgi:hypothetical protein
MSHSRSGFSKLWQALLYIFGAGASYACSSKTPLIMQFFSEAKARGGLCEKIRADLTESLNKSLALAEADLLNGSLNLETEQAFRRTSMTK